MMEADDGMGGDDELGAEEECADELLERVQASAEAPLRKRVNEALDVLVEAQRRYSPEKIALAFNGGKDATVVMHLFRMARVVYARWLEDGGGAADAANGPPLGTVDAGKKRLPRLPPLSTLYVLRDDEFDDVRQFVRDTCERYGIVIHAYPPPFRSALRSCLDEHHFAAFILGTRRGDPDGGAVGAFAPSSPDWPNFMRVHPVLEWSYADVWRFLRLTSLPYCTLYDDGYTSLGSTHDTRPNPHLVRVDAHSGEERRLPAYCLQDEQHERAGRGAAANPQQ